MRGNGTEITFAKAFRAGAARPEADSGQQAAQPPGGLLVDLHALGEQIEGRLVLRLFRRVPHRARGAHHRLVALHQLLDHVLRGGHAEDEGLNEELRNHVSKALGPIAKPRQIQFVPELPKTRSGKIMRRLLKDVAEDRAVGDTTTLADSTVMDLIKEKLPHAAEE